MENSSYKKDKIRMYSDTYSCGECMRELQLELINEVGKGVNIKIDNYYSKKNIEIAEINTKLDTHKTWLIGLTIVVSFLVGAFFFLFTLYDKIKYLNLKP